MPNFITHSYREKMIDYRLLEVPHEMYQRPLIFKRAQRIADNFDERLVNDPKVSWRDGHFYVFDGQYTLAAMRILNGTDNFLVRCRVYQNLTIEEEAKLFARQFGEAASVPPGYLLRASILAQDSAALAFQETVTKAGLLISFSQHPGKNRIACIATSRKQFDAIGPAKFSEAISILRDCWDGEAESFRAENMIALCRFVDLYHGEFDRDRLIRKLTSVGPMYIYEQSSLIGSQLSPEEKYLEQVFNVYNGTSKKHALLKKY